MTIIIRNDIRINEKTGRYNNYGVIRKTVKDIIHEGKVIEWIDLTEATASSPWAKLKFKEKNQIWIEQLHRIKDLYKTI